MKRRLKFGLGAVKQQGKWLAEWLNDGPEHGRDKTRIKNIIGLLQKLQGALRPGTPMWKLPEAQRLEKELEGVTCFYFTWPRFTVASDTSWIGIAHMWERGSLEETQAVHVIEKLLETDLLTRLTLCVTCKSRWVFRAKSDNKYCGWKCRQAGYEATAERKALKAKRNREYYDRWLRINRKRRKYAKK